MLIDETLINFFIASLRIPSKVEVLTGFTQNKYFSFLTLMLFFNIQQKRTYLRERSNIDVVWREERGKLIFKNFINYALYSYILNRMRHSLGGKST